MKKKVYETLGMNLLSLPVTNNNRRNNRRRNVVDLEATSAAHVLNVADIFPEEPLLICGRHNKAIPLMRQLTRMSSRPFALIGTGRDLGEESCLRMLDTEWETESLDRRLSDGNGIMVLKPGPETNLGLKEYLPEWDSHLLILCIGNGLQLDQELLNLLNSIGHYILLSENLQRSVKSSDGEKLTPAELLASMEYIVVSSIGTAGKELLKILPDYEYEKIENAMDFSMHQDSPHEGHGHHHRNGGGLRLGQVRSQENRCIFTQDDLIRMQDANITMIHNARNSHTWVARITS